MAEGAPIRRVPVLSLFADVREGEGWSAIVLTLNVFILLCAYYLLKVAREPLILTGSGGAEVKSYASAGQAVILAVATPLYGALASRLSRIKLITSVTLFFVANLAVFVGLLRAGVSIGVPFYLWVGIFNMMVVAQFWAFAADLYSSEQGKRIFPVVGIGSTIGAIAGSQLAKSLVGLGSATLMSTAAALLGASLVLTIAVNRREKPRARDNSTNAPDSDAIGGENGFKLLVSDRYLLGIGALAILINLVNTTGEYILDRTLLLNAAADAAARGITKEALIGEFKADYFRAVNIAVTVIQMFVVSRVIKHLGIVFALVVVPLISLGGYLTIALAPILTVVFYAKVAENSLDYSLQNTARQTLWLATSRAAKYKAKVIVDSFLVRIGDVFSAGLVLLGTRLALTVTQLAPVNAALVCVWLGAAVFVGRENRRRAPEEAPAKEAAA